LCWGLPLAIKYKDYKPENRKKGFRKRGARVGVMELRVMRTWKNGNEDGRSHFCLVPNGQKSDCKIREVSGSIIAPFQSLS